MAFRVLVLKFCSFSKDQISELSQVFAPQKSILRVVLADGAAVVGCTTYFSSAHLTIIN